MKKQILAGLVILFAVLLLGGFFILYCTNSVTKKLESLMLLQQVEHLSTTLTHEIQVSQSTLQLVIEGALTSNKTDLFDDISVIDSGIARCVDCHQADPHFLALADLGRDYLKSLRRTHTLSDDPAQMAEASELAYVKGVKLFNTLSWLTESATAQLTRRTSEANEEISQTRQVIAGLVIVGPIGLLLATMLFLRRVNFSVAALVAAARQLGRGNLDFRINQPLKNEFLEVATAFNSMAIAISNEKKNSAAAQRLYKALFESAKDAILIMSTEPTNPGKVISANKAAIDLFGYSFEELKDMCCGELCAEESDNSCRERINRILSGEWVERVTDRRRKDGSLFKAEVSAGPMVIDNINYMLTFTRDITEREQAKQELLRANQMSIVGQMAVGLAHEIKNPLAGIKATIEVLISDLNLEDDDRELMLRLISEIDRMERLLKNLLRYARPPQPHLEVTNINRLLEYTMRNVEVTSAKTTTDKIHFAKELSTKPIPIEIDPEQLQQVLLNLYLNAVEAIKGPGQITTRSRVSQDGSRLFIDISDTGEGMSETVRSNLFKPFFTTKSKGTGLGLAICLRMIEQHKGTILVDSQPGKGSTFTIVLPTHSKQGIEDHG